MTFQDAPAAQIALAEAVAKTAAPAGASPAQPVRFTGDSRAFWRLLLRGAVLLAVTLGIYRFWLATDVRRFLWSSTEIAGESLEYNGTATELLIGFLIAIALLIPINLSFFVLALSMGTAGELASVLGFPVLFVLGQFAVYRARRYRLTRTVFRGIRCHQTGSAIRYAFCATFWWVLIVLTLGLAYPFMQASLERYKMRNTWYGDLPGRFEGSGFRLFLRGLLMWLLVVGPLVFAILAVIGAVDWDGLGEAMTGGDNTLARVIMSDGFQAAIVLGVSGLTASIVFAVLLFPVFQATVLRWWLSGIRFGALTVHSHLLKRRIYGAYLRFLLYALLFTLLAGLAGFLGLLVFGSGTPGGAGAEIAGTLGAVALYVVGMLGFSTIYQATVRLALWRHGAESLEIEGLAVLDQVKALGDPSSAVGEGLADALNVGGI